MDISNLNLIYVAIAVLILNIVITIVLFVKSESSYLSFSKKLEEMLGTFFIILFAEGALYAGAKYLYENPIYIAYGIGILIAFFLFMMIIIKIGENLGIIDFYSFFWTFFISWVVILLINQIFIFGACFEPYCLLAALPHTGIIAIILAYIIDKSS